MKKIGKYIDTIFIIILVLTTFIFEVKADSGFDGSYDSGSSSSYYSDSYSSSSSSSNYWSSGSSSSSNYSIGNSGEMFIYLVFTIIYIIGNVGLKGVLLPKKNPKKENKVGKILFTIITITIYCILIYLLFGIVDLFFSMIFITLFGVAQFDNRRLKSSKQEDKVIPKQEEKPNIEKPMNDINIEEFYKEVFKIYKDIQIAWMNNTLEEVRGILSDEMFNMYKMQLMTLTTKNQKNMMEDITFIEANIMNIRKNSNKEEIDVALTVTCRDYIIDTNTNEVLRGDKNIITEYTYKLSLIKNNQKVNIDTCPNCGAKIENKASIKCKYCNSIIVQDTDNYVLTEKKVLNQRRK